MKLEIGMRVEMTNEAVKAFLDQPSGVRTGTVCGLSRDGLFVYVIKDGYVGSHRYHPSFWKPVRL